MELQTPLSSKELSELEAFLDSEAVPDECMNYAMLDGFLTCLVIGPDMVMPSEWMPVVWSDSEEPVFETMEQAERIIGPHVPSYEQHRSDISERSALSHALP